MSKYIKCPICDLNYIKDGEEMCKVCKECSKNNDSNYCFDEECVINEYSNDLICNRFDSETNDFCLRLKDY